MKKYNMHQRLADGTYLTLLDRPPFWHRARGYVLSVLIALLIGAVSWNVNQ